jgi:hypothetical protein
MAIRLTGWLEETFAIQLLLGHSWLHEKNKLPRTGATSDPVRAWRGLYNDNGSCLDITNDIHPEHNSYLQIIQACDIVTLRTAPPLADFHLAQISPLVLTDGQSQVVAQTLPECLPNLHQLPQSSVLHAVIAVRRYTIRHTAYGPPRDRLRLILHTVDWLGHSKKINLGSHSDPLKPLWSDDILERLQQLHRSRAEEDRKCLGSEVEIGEDIAITMPGTDDLSQSASQPHTQFAFGTQIAHPARTQQSQDEPQLLGVNRLEPIMAGNTEREDIRPKFVKPAYPDRETLLSLLGRPAMPSKSTSNKKPADGLSRASLSKPQRASESSGSQLSTQLPILANRQPTQTQHVRKEAARASPPQARTTKRVRDAELASPRAEAGMDQAPTAVATKDSETYSLQTMASECSWMKDFEFSREALKVPHNQLVILQSVDSWYKPQPGRRFPDGNVPITILTTLHRLADENAAMEAGPNSDDEMDEDPSPGFPSKSSHPSVESAPQITKEDALPSSPCSWSSSPGPEPPRIAAQSNQGLPPDSSFEIAEEVVDTSTGEVSAPLQSKDPIITESSNETKQDVPASSLPVNDNVDYDEEMEMEEFVPQGLGEDGMEGASALRAPEALSLSPLPRPVVQVIETPHPKGKSNSQQKYVSSPSQARDWSDTSKKTSPSIVYGTYNNNALPQSTIHPLGRNISVGAIDIVNEHYSAHIQVPQHPRAIEGSERIANDTNLDVAMPDAALPAVSPIRPQEDQVAKNTDAQSTTRVSLPNIVSPFAQTQASVVAPSIAPSSVSSEREGSTHQPLNEASTTKTSSLTPGPIKRKLTHSPSKGSNRHSKRREIKIVGFGDESPDSVDSTTALRQYREDSLRKFREARKPSTSLKSRPRSDGKLDIQQIRDPMEIDPSPGASTPDIASPVISPRHISLYEDLSPSKTAPDALKVSHSPSGSPPIVQPRALSDLEHPPFHTPSKQPSSIPTVDTKDHTLNVFESFKEAYPEYPGNVKHFQGQCLGMIKLDREDKMVPKWQWDDFIIRNITDYRGYVMNCLTESIDSEPYHRFYKDTFCDTIYRKGIIKGRHTLLQALQELELQPPVAESHRSPETSPRREKRSRASLPSVDRHSKTSKGYLNGIAVNPTRYSLPAKPPVSRNLDTPAKSVHETKIRTPAQSATPNASSSDRATPRPNFLSRLSLDGASSPRRSLNGDAVAGASDPFRDAVFAYQRLTSLTGSTRVSSKRQHSEGRKS